jgi:hypothetical protein
MAYLIATLALVLSVIALTRRTGPVERSCVVCGEPLGGNQVDCPRGPHN